MSDHMCTLHMECKNCEAELVIPEFGGRHLGAIEMSLAEATELLGFAQGSQHQQLSRIDVYWVICAECNRAYSYTPYDVFINLPPELVQELQKTP